MAIAVSAPITCQGIPSSAAEAARRRSPWINQVERFFAGLPGDCAREGSLASAAELIRRNEACLAERYLNPKPYRWKAKGREILEKIQRARQALSAA
ncbi:MAG: hypothetical protein WA624_15120 [Methylocella sp.]